MENYDILTNDLLREVGKIIKENKSIKENNLIEYNEFEYEPEEDGGLLDGVEDPEASVEFEEPESIEEPVSDEEMYATDDVSTEDDVMTQIAGMETNDQVEYLLNNGYDEEKIIALLTKDETPVYNEGANEATVGMVEGTEEIEEAKEEIEESEEIDETLDGQLVPEMKEEVTEEVTEGGDEVSNAIEESTEEIEEAKEELDEDIGDTMSTDHKAAISHYLEIGLGKEEIESVKPATLIHMYKAETQE